MDEIHARVAALTKEVEALSKIVRLGMDADRLLRLQQESNEKRQKEVNDRFFKNQRFLYDKIVLVFHELFPSQQRFDLELEEIVGRAVGPEDPKRKET